MFHIFVDASKILDFHKHSSFFADLPLDPVMGRLIDLKYATRRLPLVVIAPLDHQDAVKIINNNASHADGVLGRVRH